MVFLACNIFCYATQLDSGLFTTYNTDTPGANLYWTTCGSIPPGVGCYAAGEFGPFGKIGSVIEGTKSYSDSKDTVTRHIYILDQEYGSSKNEVALYDYKRVDTIVNGNDTVTTTLVKTLSLPLTGGASATVFMGANPKYLLVGSSLTNIPVEVKKSNYTITPMNIISQAPVSITADNYGFITVTSADGFFVVGPNGELQEDGGGSPTTINDILGLLPLPVS